MHGCYMISCNTSVKNNFKKMDEFMIIFSALVHDTDHTARTNHFEIMSRSKLACRYHFSSVLENHHIAKTFKELDKKENDILGNFSQD